MSYIDKIVYGLSNIKIDNMPILGAISTQIDISSDRTVCSNKTDNYIFNKITEINGELEVLSLTKEEFLLLFDNYKQGTLGELEFVDNAVPTFHILSFETDTASNKKIRYEFPKVEFKPSGFELSTLEDEIDEKTTTINFVAYKKDGKYYSMSID